MLEEPWDALVVVGALVLEVGEIFFWFWYSKRRRIQAGAETLIGDVGVVVTACRPVGHIRLQGELWEAMCAAGADPGDRVRVVGREGLRLEVEAAAP